MVNDSKMMEFVQLELCAASKAFVDSIVNNLLWNDEHHNGGV